MSTMLNIFKAVTMATGRMLAVMAGLLGLAGCAGDIITSSSAVRGIPSHERSAMVNGPRLVQIIGTPPDGSSPDAVAATMRIPGERNTEPFTVVPTANRGRRIVIEFGTRNGGPRACTRPTGGNNTQTLMMAVTYCDGRRDISSASVRSTGVAGPSDLTFAGVMNRTMQALLTVERPRRRDG